MYVKRMGIHFLFKDRLSRQPRLVLGDYISYLCYERMGCLFWNFSCLKIFQSMDVSVLITIDPFASSTGASYGCSCFALIKILPSK